MFIAGKGLSPEVREISIAKSEQRTEAFLAINGYVARPDHG